ncbi:apoptosis-inducing factor 3-like isoform X2 [Trichoplusia ni]|uniref:Apoptosis-inducing factor 3-like isoform X2 n=1 Tax=Trichoplusia ni TaxID=7111 RepID=A0A7E5WIQ0_TRINI|nr:apoptosis-inducing factor 3-like isoform X2 [Trichoplusia ni]
MEENLFHNIMLVISLKLFRSRPFSCLLRNTSNYRFEIKTILQWFYKRIGDAKMGAKASNMQQSSSNGTDADNYVESVVCHENDINENEMKVFDIGDEGKVLIVKQKGEINAMGTACTHYGAPLVSGALGDGRVRCPWHGACFNIKTGDIEDFPGFDAIPCYKVTITPKGEVKVRAKLSELKSKKRIKDIGMDTRTDQTVAVIIGGGPSGATCAETLRSEGFKGRVIMVCKEKYLPYDRVKVSKISSIAAIEKLEVRTDEYYRNANIEVIKGNGATKVDAAKKIVHLEDGKQLNFDKLFIATGVTPRIPDIPGVNLKNIFTVRDYEDSVNILNALGTEKDKHVVVLGLSYIGLESASSCNEKSKSMTVVGKDKTPLGILFGHEIGRSLQKFYEDRGVKFEFETVISKCNGENGYIKSVELTNGKVLPADMLIMGIGSVLNTGFLKDSGLAIEPNGAVTVDNRLETNIKDIYAGGDMASAPVFAAGNKNIAISHIGLAQYHGRIAAFNMANKETFLKSVPFFWTVLFGKSIRYAGCGKAASTQIVGDIEELKFVIYFFDENDKVIAVGSCMRDPVVAQYAEFVTQGKTLYKKDLTEDPFAWTKEITNFEQ